MYITIRIVTSSHLKNVAAAALETKPQQLQELRWIKRPKGRGITVVRYTPRASRVDKDRAGCDGGREEDAQGGDADPRGRRVPFSLLPPCFLLSRGATVTVTGRCVAFFSAGHGQNEATVTLTVVPVASKNGNASVMVLGALLPYNLVQYEIIVWRSNATRADWDESCGVGS
ncbi:hypothetical protein B0H13DRAFT_1863170 [Mycena leptocephala]|nr:hypothetical protein B0H13DRAFT_1863170 [Mycena leptocephala]